MLFVRPAVLAAAMAALGAACGGSGGTTAARPPEPGPTAASPSPAAGVPSSGPPAAPATADVPEPLRFTATGVDGSPVVGASFAGQDVALWFWAPW